MGGILAGAEGSVQVVARAQGRGTSTATGIGGTMTSHNQLPAGEGRWWSQSPFPNKVELGLLAVLLAPSADLLRRVGWRECVRSFPNLGLLDRIWCFPTGGAFFRTSCTCYASDSACRPAMGGAAAAVRAGSEDFSGEIGGGLGWWLPPPFLPRSRACTADPSTKRQDDEP
jgi:hypothetical protein